MLSVQTIEHLKKKNYNVELNLYGNGDEYNTVKKYIQKNNLTDSVFLHGNQPKEIVKKAFRESHFLLFISRSEGWPKVIAEAMFWSCLPIASRVSCIPFMLDFGERGTLVSENIDEIVTTIETYISDEEHYQTSVKKAREWSQRYTLDTFSEAIKKLVVD